MNKRTLARLITPIAAAALVPATMATPAVATAVSGLTRTQTPWTPDDATSPKSGRASCPAGKRIIGGGAQINDHGEGQTMLAQLEPVRNAQNGDWYDAAAYAIPGYIGNWSLQVYAICANPIPGLGVYFHTGDFGPAAFKDVKLACPVGKRVLSAGGRVYNGGGRVGLQLVRASRPLDIF